jgi:hypothetical protein
MVDGDASCRLYEGSDIIHLDTLVPADKVDAILHMGCGLEYESINGRPLYVFDREEAPPRRFGSSLMFYKLDNTTRNKDWAKTLHEERKRWERGNGEDRHLQGTCKALALQTDLHTEKQKDLPLGADSREVGVEQGIIHPNELLKAHVRQEHKGKYVEGCEACFEEKKAAGQ